MTGTAPPTAAWQRLYNEVPGWVSLRVHAEYWADGKCTLAEIAHLVEIETGTALGPALVTYFRLLEHAGLVRFV